MKVEKVYESHKEQIETESERNSSCFTHSQRQFQFHNGSVRRESGSDVKLAQITLKEPPNLREM